MPTSTSTERQTRRDPSFDASIGAVLASLRRGRSITQQQLAKQTGLERSFISEIERGLKGMTLLTFYRIAAVLEIPPHIILKTVDDFLWPFVPKRQSSR